MSKKPSPAQAVMLRDLATRYAWASTVRNRSGKIYQATAHGENVYDLMPLSPPTFQALISRGWVENSERVRVEDYAGPQVTVAQLERARAMVANTNADSWKISDSGRALLASLRAEDFLPRPSHSPEFTSDDLYKALREYYCPPEWIFFGELRAGSGYSHGADQRIDGWAMDCYPSKGLLKLAFEIKVSRADFLRELKQPQKRAFALSVSNLFYFVTPPGLVSIDELPEDCGLMEVSAGGEIRFIRKVPQRPCERPSWRFIASLGRRIEIMLSKEESHA